MTWHGNRGKTKLIKELVAKGLSYRKAEKAVNAVFDKIACALIAGERTVIPGGMLIIKDNNRNYRKFQKIGDISGRAAEVQVHPLRSI